MLTAAAALAALTRSGAIPVTVRLTDLTVEAVAGTVSCTWSCRAAESASTAPRSHKDAPLSLPQPKVNPGAPVSAGAACNRRVASGTSPPVVQAVTVQPADWPRTVLACAGWTDTHRLTCMASVTVAA